MKRQPTTLGRMIIAATALWITTSDARHKKSGRYATDQEIADARQGLARLNRDRAHAGQLSLLANCASPDRSA